MQTKFIVTQELKWMLGIGVPVLILTSYDPFVLFNIWWRIIRFDDSLKVLLLRKIHN